MPVWKPRPGVMTLRRTAGPTGLPIRCLRAEERFPLRSAAEVFWAAVRTETIPMMTLTNFSPTQSIIPIRIEKDRRSSIRTGTGLLYDNDLFGEQLLSIGKPCYIGARRQCPI